jgi:hypothetical protein
MCDNVPHAPHSRGRFPRTVRYSRRDRGIQSPRAATRFNACETVDFVVTVAMKNREVFLLPLSRKLTVGHTAIQNKFYHRSAQEYDCIISRAATEEKG